MTQERERPRVLVVEDDAVNRRALSLLLRQLGHDVSEAATLMDAFRQLDNCTHLLLDVGLPDGFGTELAEAIQKRRLPVHVAVMTALDPHSPDIQRVRAAEPDIILRKPILLGSLLEWLGTKSDIAE